MSDINLEGPDTWVLYVNGGYWECDLTVEHNYYRNASNDEKYLTQSMLLEMIYPIGSIYTSTRNVNPGNIFGGTWSAIVDRFLYCVNPASAQSGVTGGSKKISVANLPAHNHASRLCNWYDQGNASSTKICGTGPSATWKDENSYCPTTNTGSGTDYMPPYYTVYAWTRTE